MIRQRMSRTGENYRSASQWLIHAQGIPPNENVSGSELIPGLINGEMMTSIQTEQLEPDQILSRAIDNCRQSLNLSKLSKEEENLLHALYTAGIIEGIRQMKLQQEGNENNSSSDKWPERKNWISRYKIWANRRETEIDQPFRRSQAAMELKISPGTLYRILSDRNCERPRDRCLRQTAEMFGCDAVEFNPDIN